MNGLLVCHRVRLPYRVMRCMVDAGVRVYVLGNTLSTGLKHSKYCSGFYSSDVQFDGTFSEAMAEEINRYVEKLGIDVVFPGDALSSRSFHGVKHLIKAPCFPGPDLDQFDLLNNKWEFTQLCGRLGIPCPATRMFDTKAKLAEAIRLETVPMPLIAKPLTMDGEKGVIKLSCDNLEAQLAEVFYEPILVQEFIEGEDIGASVYCTDGEIVSFIAHKLDKGIYSTFADDGIRTAISKVSEELKLNGVYNFDMRLTPQGRVLFLECNPRFYFKMYLSLVAGINFVLPGISPKSPRIVKELSEDTATRTPRAWPRLLVRPWAATTRDRHLMRFLLSDPTSFVREQAHIDWD